MSILVSITLMICAVFAIAVILTGKYHLIPIVTLPGLFLSHLTGVVALSLLFSSVAMVIAVVMLVVGNIDKLKSLS